MARVPFPNIDGLPEPARSQIYRNFAALAEPSAAGAVETLSTQQQSLQESLVTLGWLGATNITVTSDNAFSKVGNRSLRAEVTGTPNAFIFAVLDQPFILVSPGDSVTFTAWAYKDSGQPALGAGLDFYAKLDWYGTAGAISTDYSAAVTGVDDTWVALSVTATAPDGAGSVRPGLQGYSNDGSAFPANYKTWFDDMHNLAPARR